MRKTLPVCLAGVSGERDDGHCVIDKLPVRRKGITLADGVGGLYAVHDRHALVHQDEVKLVLHQSLNARLAVVSQRAPVAHFFEKGLDDDLVGYRILGNQNIEGMRMGVRHIVVAFGRLLPHLQGQVKVKH